MNENIIFYFDWLKLPKYDFKIMLLVKMLATDARQLTYTGTLKNMRDWLELGQSKKNNEKIKTAIESLKDKNYIKYTKLGAYKYKINILDANVKADPFPIAIKVEKQDILTIKTHNRDNNNNIIDKELVSASWDNMAKVYIFLLNNNPDSIRTQQKISYVLNLTAGQVGSAIRALKQCNFKDNTAVETIKKYYYSYYCGGSQMRVIKDFSKNKKI